MNYRADTDMLENVCNENNRSRLVGVQRAGVAVDTAVLARYEGQYAFSGGSPIVAGFMGMNQKVTLVNGPTMAPHPTDADILYFVFGTNYANEGTWLYRYDDSTGQVTRQHNTYHDVFAITFLPGDPSVMYLGLTIEQI